MFDRIYQYNFPTTIRFGAGSVKELADHIQQNNLKAPLIVTDPTVAGLPFFKNIVADLTRRFSMISIRTL
jgi:alcohol dehydrogenase class IV